MRCFSVQVIWNKSKRVLPVAIPILISLVALGSSYRSNIIAEKSLKASNRTYLWVEPALLPLGTPMLSDLEQLAGKDYEDGRYLVVIGLDHGIQISLNTEIRNSGLHEAKSVVMHYYFEFVPTPYVETLFSYSGTVPVESIAPGQTVLQDFYLRTKKPSQPRPKLTIGRKLMEAFEKDEVEVRVSLYLTFSDPSSEERKSGVYHGTYRYGGRQILRGDFAGNATVEMKLGEMKQ